MLIIYLKGEQFLSTSIALKHEDIRAKTAQCAVGLIRGRISSGPGGFMKIFGMNS